MNEKEVRKLLLKKIRYAGSQTEFASQNKMSVTYVNDILHGRKGPGPRMLKALGLKSKIVYEEK